MSIKNRLIVSFSLMVGLSLLLGAILISAFWMLRSRYIDYEYGRRLLDTVVELKQNFEKQERSLDGYLLGLESEKDHFGTLEAEADQVLEEWRKEAVGAAEQGEQRKMERELKSLRSELAGIFPLVESSRRTEAIRAVEERVMPVRESLDRDFKVLVFKKKVEVNQSWESAKRLASRTIQFSVLLLLSAALSGVGFTLLIYQSIAQPLSKLREGTQKIAQGDWDLKLNLNEPEELAALARSFEEMAKSLSGLQAQVVQMDRMSAVGTLAGGVAHEINNPLTGVMGQAQLVLERMAPDDPNRSNVAKIERAAQRCRKIVRSLLDFSRPQEYAFAAVDAGHVIANALAFCETQILASGIRIDWEKDPNLPKIWASENHLQQVFLNIVTNAMHAMPKGGTLTIRARLLRSGQSEPVPGKEIVLNESLDFVQVDFTDTGVGIAPEHLRSLFDPFFTTKEPGKGTGLGLSISFGIIQQHHGYIEALSEGPGQGATFRIWIPAAPLDIGGEPKDAVMAGQEPV